MRLILLPLLFGAAVWAAAASSDSSDEEGAGENTYFNGIKVPPMLELTQDNWEEEYKSSQWLMVKHYRYMQEKNHCRNKTTHRS
jgi:protein disulfide-isomerase